MNSIRKKLLRWLLIGQLAAVVLTGSISFFYVRSELEDLFDDRLRQLAYSVPFTDRLVPPPQAPLTNLKDDDDDFVIQVWQDNGRLLLHLNRKEGAPERAEEGYSTHLSAGMLWRSFALHRGDRLVQVSQPFTDRLEMSLGVALGATAPVLVLIIALGVLVWISVGRGLKPLSRLTAALQQRRPHALEPLPEQGLPVEILPLVQALNQLLGQLENAREEQRKFIADAAHELRTPLTAVQLQVQLLERTDGESARQQVLRQVQAGTVRAGHLVQQLLTLARLEPEDWQRPFAPVDLSDLVKSVVSDHTPAALHKQIDLGISRDMALSVYGDSESLRIMLGNLLDNAIRYSPSGGRVDVALAQSENSARIEIQDKGPGIPVQERRQVFSRFYRPPGSRELGSGLGLAIVQEIVRRHRGDIRLEDAASGSGLKVCITLPGNKISEERQA